MELFSQVPTIQVKRAFVTTNDIAKQNRKKRLKISSNEFKKGVARTKRRVAKLNDKQLDHIIGAQYAKRRDAYNRMRWYLGTAKIGEIAVWRGAGGLPPSWTSGSLTSTTKKVALAMKKKSKLFKQRAKFAIPRILSNSLDVAQREKYLLPIILPAGTIKSCRGGFKKFKGDIDDGCMRSIALAISGKKSIKAYIGMVDKEKKTKRGA